MSAEWMQAHAHTAMQLPKPTRADRKRVIFDTSDMAHPKAGFVRDGDYRAWIRTHRCVLPDFEQKCGRISGERGEVEAAHLQHGGRGIKGSDASCIPLCPVHHDMLDAETLPWQIVAFLWMRCWGLREQWWKRSER